MNTITCKVCAKEFTPESSRIAHCSRDCARVSAAATRRAAPRTAAPRPTFTCGGCGKLSTRGECATGKFCSVQCMQNVSWAARCLQIKEAGSFFTAGQKHFPAGVVRRYLKKEFGNKCAICSLPGEWRGNPLTLTIDHADGNPTNHKPANVRLVCPNCDSQSTTYRGRNRGNGRKSKGVWTDPSIRGRNRQPSK